MARVRADTWSGRGTIHLNHFRGGISFAGAEAEWERGCCAPRRRLICQLNVTEKLSGGVLSSTRRYGTVPHPHLPPIPKQPPETEKIYRFNNNRSEFDGDNPYAELYDFPRRIAAPFLQGVVDILYHIFHFPRFRPTDFLRGFSRHVVVSFDGRTFRVTETRARVFDEKIRSIFQILP